MTRVATIALAAMTAGTAMAADCYVDANAPSGGDGQSWGTAYQSIQTALSAANANDTIIVTNGTYAPITRTDNASITIRSVNGPAFTFINGNGATRCATLGSNPMRTNIVLSGFTLANGVANSSSRGGARGGGALCGTLNNCILTGNRADYDGGGAFYSTLTGCTLTGNTASQYGGGSSYGTLNNCTLSGNTANRHGGGAYDSTLDNCNLTDTTPWFTPTNSGTRFFKVEVRLE